MQLKKLKWPLLVTASIILLLLMEYSGIQAFLFAFVILFCCSIEYMLGRCIVTLLNKKSNRGEINKAIIWLVIFLIINVVLISVLFLLGLGSFVAQIVFLILLLIINTTTSLPENKENKKMYKFLISTVLYITLTLVSVFILPRGLSHSYKEVDRIIINEIAIEKDTTKIIEVEDSEKVYKMFRNSLKIIKYESDEAYGWDSTFEILIEYSDGTTDYLRNRKYSENDFVLSKYNGSSYMKHVTFYNVSVLDEFYFGNNKPKIDNFKYFLSVVVIIAVGYVLYYLVINGFLKFITWLKADDDSDERF